MYQVFPSNFFCVTVLKCFIGEPSSVSILSGIGSVWMRGGGRIKIFRRKFFVFQCQKFP